MDVSDEAEFHHVSLVKTCPSPDLLEANDLPDQHHQLDSAMMRIPNACFDVSISAFRSFLAMTLLVTATVGCSRGPKPVRPPKVVPQDAAAAALDAYDKNDDGQLDEQELPQCPGLLDGMASYDKNSDGSIDTDEIEQRLNAIYSSGVGMLNLGCRVLSKGRPIPDCVVTLIPEDFLGGAVKPASGTTRASGTAMLRIAPSDLPAGLENVRGVHCGVYRVELSHSSSTISKLIEKAGPLGFDVSMEDQVPGLTIDLGR